MANCNVSIFGPNQGAEADALYNEAKSKPTKLGASISGPVDALRIKRPDNSKPSTRIEEVALGSFIVVIWDK